MRILTNSIFLSNQTCMYIDSRECMHSWYATFGCFIRRNDSSSKHASTVTKALVRRIFLNRKHFASHVNIKLNGHDKSTWLPTNICLSSKRRSIRKLYPSYPWNLSSMYDEKCEQRSRNANHLAAGLAVSVETVPRERLGGLASLHALRSS